MLVSELLKELLKDAWHHRNLTRWEQAEVLVERGGTRGMLEDSPAPKLFASTWWARLATIAVEREQRSRKKKKRWTSVLWKLIRTRSN